jgi:hypothetical protein
MRNVLEAFKSPVVLLILFLVALGIAGHYDRQTALDEATTDTQVQTDGGR